MRAGDGIVRAGEGSKKNLNSLLPKFTIEFINCILKGKKLLDYTNLFSPNDFKKNNQVIKRIFKNE